MGDMTDSGLVEVEIPRNSDAPLGTPHPVSVQDPDVSIRLRPLFALLFLVAGIGIIVSVCFATSVRLGIGSVGVMLVFFGMILAYEEV